ncbi:hypothetical protein IAC76_05355 [Spirochaetes bacterium]|uniref:Uncharacterized protein n=1 Tax=Candidatus Scatousia excrementipullorum TaxID=2840936 RepID=A0A9D9DRE0_9BACT|nr:hypothetical protein [Candidatus Scatousia excrementipullorum]
MERILKNIKYLLLFGCISILPASVNGEEIYSPQPQIFEPSISTLVTPQNMAFDDCTKEYNMNQEKLYYLTIAAINENRFEIEELQSKTGYILFKAVNKEFLATVVKLGVNKSMLKITPTNNNYYFAPGIVLNIFKYIDLNLNENITPIKKI